MSARPVDAVERLRRQCRRQWRALNESCLEVCANASEAEAAGDFAAAQRWNEVLFENGIVLVPEEHVQRLTLQHSSGPQVVE